MSNRFRFIDLFSGIGGMRIPFDELDYKCVLSSDWDKDAQEMYNANFGEYPVGDITKINANDIPDHDLLLAGFPCQAFSIMGKMNGFSDTRGTLFFEIERILKEKRPGAFLLENVKMLVGHQKGMTLKVILNHLRELGYYVHWKVLNALDFGIPQKRERIYIVGFKKNYAFKFPLGEPGQYIPLSDILEQEVDPKFYASERIQLKRNRAHKSNHEISIWHENKSGHISSYPYSCALRASASYNYLLVNGVRRLTPRECLRLMGFPDETKIVSSYQQIRKLIGNSVAVPVVRSLAKEINKCLSETTPIAKFLPRIEREQLSLSI